jgi:hypothetical protein
VAILWVHRSALTLKLLTCAPTGMRDAAFTVGGTRNRDYRYVGDHLAGHWPAHHALAVSRSTAS